MKTFNFYCDESSNGMNDITEIFDNEQWGKVFEKIFKNKDLVLSIDPADLAWKRFQYQLVENGKYDLVAPFGNFSDLLKIVEFCKGQGFLGLTIPQATAFQQPDQIKTLLANGHKIDEQEFGESTGLLVAAVLNDYELVEFFIDNGAFVSFYNQDSFEAIDLTTSQNIIDLLTKNKGKTKQQRSEVYNEYCDARGKLNDHREANLNFIIAAKNGDLVKMNEALTDNIMPFITIDFADNETGNTALHYAVLNKDQKVIDFLLSKRIDKNKANRKGITAQELAKQLGNEKLFDDAER